ncbi:MAG: hypothetical protein B7Z08_08825 [Sphingomonadales bacterium 32-68-7]|nr:MAG: hypothetical protein B7Z33_02535 [Sphingomonadales bacterium 12-68-11]OYX08575.1 MAG: hypothetical protein B7Z08_08825 [Sphingomonadales bacterium 32-68-7]
MASFADLAALTESAQIVVLVEVRDQAVVEPERAPGLAPGHARLYLEARTQALLAGRSGLGQDLVYLADVPLLANGRPPKLGKQRFVLYANSVPERPGSLQLIAPDSYVPATPESEALARWVIAALAAPEAPPPLGAIREVMSVAGNLAGESETQLFFATDDGQPVSLTVIRRPGMAPQWGVSWTEIVDQAARPPAPDTAEWYRLACFLPERIPASAFLQEDRAARTRAEADYQVIREQLGPCTRLRG